MKAVGLILEDSPEYKLDSSDITASQDLLHTVYPTLSVRVHAGESSFPCSITLALTGLGGGCYFKENVINNKY